MITKLFNPREPARLPASELIPSIIQPSPARIYIFALNNSSLNLEAKSFCAIDIPVPAAIPCPNGPVVVSIPGATPYSGWPGVLELNNRKFFISSNDRSYPLR